MLVVVPAITSEQERRENIAIRQHLNIWSPRQWRFVLAEYFESVEAFAHQPAPGVTLVDFNDTPDRCSVSETDFRLLPTTVERMQVVDGTLGAVFLVRRPRPFRSEA